MTTADDEQNSLKSKRMSIQKFGLCVRCRHVLPTASPNSVFVRCALSRVDPGYPRYPMVPVTSCRGFELATGGS